MLRFFGWLNLHVPFVALGMLASASACLQLPLPSGLLIAAMGGSLIVYLLDRRALSVPEEDLLNHPERSEWLLGHRHVWLALLAVGGGGLITGVVLLPLRQSLALLCYLPIGLAYVLPLLPGKKRIKDLPYVKTLIIVAGWSAVPLLLPDATTSRAIWLWVLYRALFVLPNLLLGDWKDQTGDRMAGHKTLGQLLPREPLRAVCCSCLLLGAILAWQSGNLLWRIDAIGYGIFATGIAGSGNLTACARRVDLFMLWPLVTSLPVLY